MRFERRNRSPVGRCNVQELWNCDCNLMQLGLGLTASGIKEHLQVRLVMNWSDVAEIEELSEPELAQPADTADISTSNSVFKRLCGHNGRVNIPIKEKKKILHLGHAHFVCLQIQILALYRYRARQQHCFIGVISSRQTSTRNNNNNTKKDCFWINYLTTIKY